MALKPFKKLKSGTREVDQLQENIEQSLKPVLNKQILDGLILNDINLDSTKDNLIEHKLNRELLGWIVVKQDTQSLINDKQATNTNPDQFLILNCSVNTKVSLWLF